MGDPKSRPLTAIVCVGLVGLAILFVAASLAQRESAPQPTAKTDWGDYKRIHQNIMLAFLAGKTDEGIAQAKAYLDAYPGDLESMYCLAVGHAQKGDIPTAIAYVKQAVEAGLSFGRFLAGPRNMLKPLTDSAAFQELAKQQPNVLVHGPVLGCLTAHSARFWVRTASEVPVEVLVSSAPDLANPMRSRPVTTSEKEDFIAVAEVQGLQPATEYYYDVLVDAKPCLRPNYPKFRTFPPPGANSRFQVAFGGGAGYTPQNERMWDVILSHHPTACLFLGDNVYIDQPTRPEMQQYCYYRRQSRPEYRRLSAATPIFAIWDDHDFCTNDGRGGPEVDRPEWKIPVWRVFRQNWNNPSYAGNSEKQPGCWFDFSIGDVDFFMLDCRYYRDDPKKPNSSMLGPVQKAWLFDRLKQSKGTFRVLVSSVPWTFLAKGDSLDTWNGYKQEREEIFSFLAENKIGGVVLLSADRHRSEAWEIKRDKAYTLYEFESSKLTNLHTHGLVKGALFGYNAKCSFGLLTFDTTKPDPELTYEVVSIDDEVVHTLTVKRSALTDP